jgi:hypothetical protein
MECRPTAQQTQLFQELHLATPLIDRLFLALDSIWGTDGRKPEMSTGHGY